jgi:hypothetical protein
VDLREQHQQLSEKREHEEPAAVERSHT